MIPIGVARVLRTVRHLRPAQASGQLRLRLLGPRPARATRAPERTAIAAAPVPFLGAPLHAQWMGARRLRLLNREVSFADRIDWSFSGEGPLFAYHLHQFDWARDGRLAPAVRRDVVLDWIARHPQGIGWDPGPASLRSAAWIKLLLTPGALPLDAAGRARVLASLGAQLGHVAANLETHLLANHLLTNLLSLVLAGLAFEGGDAGAWLGFEGRLRAELAEQVGADGAHFERSPMYHALMLESVLDVLSLCRATARAPAALGPALEDVAARMLGALAVWTHPDGEIALVGDAALGIAHTPAALRDYARALGVRERAPAAAGILPDAGFVRVAAGPWSLLASVAGPMPAYQPGHAHCDALAFELCVDGERVVTDTGVYEYVPGPLRDLARATRAHATIEVAGREQAEVWAAHRVGGRPRVSLIGVDSGRRLEATCASWSTPDTVHRRIVSAAPEALVVEDAIEGRDRPVRLALPLAPGLAPRLEASAGGVCARMRLRSGEWLRIDLPARAAWRIETAPIFPEFGRAVDRAVLVGESASFGRGVLRFTLARRHRAEAGG